MLLQHSSERDQSEEPLRRWSVWTSPHSGGCNPQRGVSSPTTTTATALDLYYPKCPHSKSWSFPDNLVPRNHCSEHTVYHRAVPRNHGTSSSQGLRVNPPFPAEVRMGGRRAVKGTLQREDGRAARESDAVPTSIRLQLSTRSKRKFPKGNF